jgi:hypothetical protein
VELESKRITLDQLLEQTQIDVRELQVLLHQRAADIVARVEQDLKTQVETHVPKVQQDLKLFQMRHRKETGHKLGALLEDFLMQEVESVFQRWRAQEDDKIQAQLTELSSRFLIEANGILERLEECAGALFEIPIEHLSISCSLRVESHLRYRVERVFFSLDSLLLLLPGFLLRPVVLRRMHNNVPLLLDMNSGRVRYDYVERLQASMSQFEKHLCAGITIVAEALASALHKSPEPAQQAKVPPGVIDSAIWECSQLLENQSSPETLMLRRLGRACDGIAGSPTHVPTPQYLSGRSMHGRDGPPRAQVQEES